MREHQRIGVQFMFECVTGQREFDGFGCILADDMGLGKTFQSVTLLWTLLTRECCHLTTALVKRNALFKRYALVKECSHLTNLSPSCAARQAPMPSLPLSAHAFLVVLLAHATDSAEGIGGCPTVKRVAIVCPTSLVKNWAAEIIKWLGDRLDGGVIAISESSREKVGPFSHRNTLAAGHVAGSSPVWRCCGQAMA